MNRKLTPLEKLKPEQIEVAINLFKSSGFLVVNKTLIKSVGLLQAALMSNYVDKYQYFREKNPSFDGWFFLRHRDIMEQLNLPESTIIRTKRELVNLNILKTKRAGAPAKEWIWIDFRNLLCRCFYADPLKTGGLDPYGPGGLYKDTILRNNIYVDSEKNKKVLEGIIPSDFEKFWEIYPSKRRGLKGKALSAFEKICKPHFAHRPTWQRVRAAILRQIESDAWKEQLKTPKASFIPLAATWLNGKRWLDDPKELKVHRFNDDKGQSEVNMNGTGGWISNKFAQ